MNDDVKNATQNVSPVIQLNQAQPQTVAQPIQPSAPVGSTNKEIASVNSNPSEFVKPSEAELKVGSELADLGVEAKKDSPNIADKHRDFIDHAKQFAPTPSSASGKVSLPMSEEEIEKKLKTGQDDDSEKWLAGLIRKIIKAMGL
jgi:hypothetical protein